MSALQVQLSPGDIAAIAAAVAAQLKKPDEQLLTVEQTETLTGLTAKALERRRSRGLAPHAVKRGRSVRYLRSEVEKYIDGSSA